MKKVIFTILIVIVIAIVGIGLYLKFGLPNQPLPDDVKVDVTPDHVARGKYLANHVTVCMDCHSRRDWSRFSGPPTPGTEGAGGEYFGVEMGFPGKFYSKNITPFHLKNWTDGEIFRTITTGENKDGNALFPIMPYTYYGRMDKEDIDDIIAYLRSLPSIENKTPERSIHFPVNFLINTFPKKTHLTQRPPKAVNAVYGAYMTNASGCRECHSPADDKGQINEKLAFSGGRTFLMNGLKTNSANLTSDKETGLGDWTSEMFVSRFKAYLDSSASPHVANNGFNTPMPWTMYAGMDTTDLEAIFAYLKTVRPIKNHVTHFESTSVAKK